ncbi:DUF2330 domain-containing protein [Embleya sp. NPDC005575]|uniref:DUF2330 domain-containing protein n=1 Tax=Embleya sp. NPDC005575 TaxID=3156892 RepID=UPI0033B1535F
MGVRGAWWDRVLRLLLAVVSIQVLMVAQPAWACGCGAAVPAGGRTLTVGQETSVVRWDGRVEEIDMQLTVSGDAEQAAWIMPVPSRASVTLGNSAMFDELEHVVAPVERVRHYFWPKSGDWPFSGDSGGGEKSARAGAPPGAGGVEVVGRERLGPFDVARLAADNPQVLGSWLTQNGFHLPAALTTALEPYVRQHWEYVAIRLAPEAPAGGGARPTTLRGSLDPLHLSFASERLVYPMRLSQLAKVPQHLRLYVVAAHRMQPRSDIGGAPPEVLYAGRPDTGRSAGPGQSTGIADRLAPIDGKPAFLTAIDQNFPTPARIVDDHELHPTARDDGYQRADYRDELLTVAGIPVWLLSVLGALVVLLVAVLVWRRRRIARRRPPIAPGPIPPRPTYAPS